MDPDRQLGLTPQIRQAHPPRLDLQDPHTPLLDGAVGPRQAQEHGGAGGPRLAHDGQGVHRVGGGVRPAARRPPGLLPLPHAPHQDHEVAGSRATASHGHRLQALRLGTGTMCLHLLPQDQLAVGVLQDRGQASGPQRAQDLPDRGAGSEHPGSELTQPQVGQAPVRQEPGGHGRVRRPQDRDHGPDPYRPVVPGGVVDEGGQRTGQGAGAEAGQALQEPVGQLTSVQGGADRLRRKAHGQGPAA